MSYYRRDKLSIKSNQILSNILAELILLTEHVETYRQLLANTPYFDCIQLFRVIDSQQKGYLCLKNFQQLIGSSHKKLVAYAFSYFDQAKLGQISRLEFSAFLLSRRNLELRQIVAERIESPQLQLSPDYVIGDQLKLFANLIQAIISQQMRIICLRKQLLKSNDYSIKGVLSSLDVNDHKWVSLSDVHKFMQNYGISTPIDQVQSIVQIMDSQLSGKITIDQLKWIVQGFQGEDKEYLKRLKAANKREVNIRSSRNTNTNNNANANTNTNHNINANHNASVNGNNNLVLQSRKTNINVLQSDRKMRQIHTPNVIIQNEQNQELKENKIQNLGDRSTNTGQFYNILKKFKEAEAQSNQVDQKLIKEELILRAQTQKQYDRIVRQKNIKQNQQYIQELRQKKNIQQQQRKKYTDYLYSKTSSNLNAYHNSYTSPYVQREYQINNNGKNVNNFTARAFNLTQKQKSQIDQKIQTYKNSKASLTHKNTSLLDKKDSIYSFSNSNKKNYGRSSRYEYLYPTYQPKYVNQYPGLNEKIDNSCKYNKKLNFFEDPYKSKYDSKANSISDYKLETKKSHLFDDYKNQTNQKLKDVQSQIKNLRFQSSQKSQSPNFQSPSRRVNQTNNTTEKWKYGNTTQTRPGLLSQQKEGLY